LHIENLAGRILGIESLGLKIEQGRPRLNLFVADRETVERGGLVAG